ncbi:MAG: GDSL-type esterase/lipase family protein [Desertimonas sp.]
MIRRLGAVAVVITGVATASCGASPTPTAGTATTTSVLVPVAPSIDTVAVIGDSITVGAEPEVREALADIGVSVLAVDARSGRRTTVDHSVDSGIAAVRRVRETEPDLYVVALGTNDVFSLDDGERAAAMIDGLLAELPEHVPLVWVDVHVVGDDGGSEVFNAALRARLGERGEATIAGWHQVAMGSDLLRDGVHPTDAGDVVFAGVIAGAVADWRA